MRLSIIIVNYNSASCLPVCLRSIERHLSHFEKEVCVVDNASADDSLEILRRDFPWVTRVASDQNLGFAAGINLGIKNTTGDYILWLNPDTELLDSGVPGVINGLEHDRHAGIAGLQILNPDKSLQLSARNFPSYETALFSRYSILTRIFPKNPWSSKYLRTHWNHQTREAVDWVSGAALLHKREVWSALGGLDEGFFMYCEDVDFCFQAKKKGWKTLYDPQASLVHLIGGSSHKVRTRMIIAHHRSMSHYYIKNLSGNIFKNGVVHSFIWVRCLFVILLSFFTREHNNIQKNGTR